MLHFESPTFFSPSAGNGLYTSPLFQLCQSEANFHSLTFGDFEFAVSQRQFRNLNPEKPIFRNILFCAIADQPAYDYYVLDNRKNRTIVHPNYILKDTLLGKSYLTIAISKNALTADLDFIRSQFSVGKK